MDVPSLVIWCALVLQAISEKTWDKKQIRNVQSDSGALFLQAYLDDVWLENTEK